MTDEPNRAKRAVKEAATNWPAMTACVCFTAIMCVTAGNLKDLSEAKTFIGGTVLTFFTLFLGYLFTGKRQ